MTRCFLNEFKEAELFSNNIMNKSDTEMLTLIVFLTIRMMDKRAQCLRKIAES